MLSVKKNPLNKLYTYKRMIGTVVQLFYIKYRF